MVRITGLIFIVFLLLSCNDAVRQNPVTYNTSRVHDTMGVLPAKVVAAAAAKPLKKNRTVAPLKTSLQLQLPAFEKTGNFSVSLEDDFKLLMPETQHFEIIPLADTDIVCRHGTIIKIHANSFVIAGTQSVPAAPVILEVKEFYQLRDMLPAGLSTVSNGALLETGGMLLIQAFSFGQPCELRSTLPAEISFPFTKQKDSMLLFHGEWDQKKVNWKKSGEQADNIESMAAFPGGKNGLYDFYFKRLYAPDSLSNPFGEETVKVAFMIDKNGDVNNIVFKSRNPKGYKDIVNNAIVKMPRWTPAYKNGFPIPSTFNQTIKFLNESYAEDGKVNDSLYKTEFETKVNDSNLVETGTAEIMHYIFSTSNLGWINCDRFYNVPGPRTNFYVDCGAYDDIDVKLVFHSIRSVLSSDVSNAIATFLQVPLNEPVTIVAIKKIRNETFISLAEANTSMGNIDGLAFEKVTLSKLKQRLEQLNSIK